VAVVDLSVHKLDAHMPHVDCSRTLANLFSNLNIPPFIVCTHTHTLTCADIKTAIFSVCRVSLSRERDICEQRERYMCVCVCVCVWS